MLRGLIQFKVYDIFQKQLSRCVVRKRCSENMLQIYRRTPWRSVISVKLQNNFIEITLWHGCSPVTLLHIFRTSFPKKTSGRLLLIFVLSMNWRNHLWNFKCSHSNLFSSVHLIGITCFDEYFSFYMITGRHYFL